MVTLAESLVCSPSGASLNPYCVFSLILLSVRLICLKKCLGEDEDPWGSKKLTPCLKLEFAVQLKNWWAPAWFDMQQPSSLLLEKLQDSKLDETRPSWIRTPLYLFKTAVMFLNSTWPALLAIANPLWAFPINADRYTLLLRGATCWKYDPLPSFSLADSSWRLHDRKLLSKISKPLAVLLIKWLLVAVSVPKIRSAVMPPPLFRITVVVSTTVFPEKSIKDTPFLWLSRNVQFDITREGASEKI